jgi:hypothetical protein
MAGAEMSNHCDRCARPVSHEVSLLHVQNGQLQRPEVGMPRFMADEHERQVLCRSCGSAVAASLREMIRRANAD